VTPAIQELIRRNEQLCDRFQQATLDEPDVATALATTAEQITLVNLPMRTGAAQHSGLRRYLTEDVLPHRPADLRRRRVSRTADRFRVVDELVVGFTHDRELPWLLPGVPPTRRTVEVLAISIVTARQGRIAGQRTLWDLAGLLAGLNLPADAVRPALIRHSAEQAEAAGWW
jgi:carboxymethylenebutenolidase